MRPELITEQYHQGDILARLEGALFAAGIPLGSVTTEDLAPFDEFHIGGRAATAELIAQIDPKPDDVILDIGCGVGGPARFVARTYGCHVVGIDLTAEFIEVGLALNDWVGMHDQVALREANALAMPFADAAFDKAYIIHVGMNIDEKTRLFTEVNRVLKAGGLFGIYDVMRVREGLLAYPLPWAASEAASALSTPKEYREALGAAGLLLIKERDRRNFAVAIFDEQRRSARPGDGEPAIGLHLLMGASAKVKNANLMKNVMDGLLSPFEMIARK